MVRLLSQHLIAASGPTRGLLLSASLKLLLQAPDNAELKKLVVGMLEKYAGSSDVDLQQRAVEYLVRLILCGGLGLGVGVGVGGWGLGLDHLGWGGA